MRIRLWQDWAILVAAAWLYVSPFVFGIASLTHPATMLAWGCAVVLMVSASEALVVPDPVEEWVDVVAALALMAGPWVFGFSTQAGPAINSFVVGLAVLGLAVSALIRERNSSAAAKGAAEG